MLKHKAALRKNVFKFLVKQSAETIAQSEKVRLFLRPRMSCLQYVSGTATVLCIQLGYVGLISSISRMEAIHVGSFRTKDKNERLAGQ